MRFILGLLMLTLSACATPCSHTQHIVFESELNGADITKFEATSRTTSPAEIDHLAAKFEDANQCYLGDI